MNKLALFALALAPIPAMAHAGGALRLGVSYNHTSLSGASANMPGATLGVGGRYRGVGVRAGLSFARGAGASLEVLNVRATANPTAALSPYLAAGLIDLASLSVATSSQTTYGINPATGVITPTTTTQALPPRGVVMGVGLVGLRARVALNPHWQIAAHAGIGAGIGGSTTGLPASAGSRSPFATDLGMVIRYRVTGHATAALTYTRDVIPVRGATFRSEAVELSMVRTF